MTCVTRKQALRSLSLSYQKKDGRGHARPSFFWYDNDKDLKACFLVTHVTVSLPPRAYFLTQRATGDSYWTTYYRTTPLQNGVPNPIYASLKQKRNELCHAKIGLTIFEFVNQSKARRAPEQPKPSF